MGLAALRIRFHVCRNDLPDRSRRLHIIIAEIIDAVAKQTATATTVPVAPDMR